MAEEPMPRATGTKPSGEGALRAPKRRAMAIGAVVLVLAALVGGILAFALRSPASKREPLSTAAPAPTPAVMATAGATPTPAAGDASRTSPPAAEAATPSAAGPAPSAKRGTRLPYLFVTDRAMGHVHELASAIGVRREGTAAEARAAQYVYDTLRSWKYDAHQESFALPNGRTSYVVWATKPGLRRETVMLGAHIDSKSPSPGANDNASGSGVILELARDVRDSTITPTLTFAWFGAEEMSDSDAEHHHYGSRWFAANMPAQLKRDLVAMVSVDMVGWGDSLAVRYLERGPGEFVDLVRQRFARAGLSTRYMPDTGRAGMSDHEPFELAGYPVAWLEWRNDPLYHTEGDDYAHLQWNVVEATGRTLRSFLVGLTAADLTALARARQR